MDNDKLVERYSRSVYTHLLSVLNSRAQFIVRLFYRLHLQAPVRRGISGNEKVDRCMCVLSLLVPNGGTPCRGTLAVLASLGLASTLKSA